MKVNKKARFRKMLIIFAETTSDISDTNQTSDLTLSSSLNGWLVSTSCVCTNSTATITLTSLICHRNSSDYVCVSRSWRTNVSDFKLQSRRSKTSFPQLNFTLINYRCYVYVRNTKPMSGMCTCVCKWMRVCLTVSEWHKHTVDIKLTSLLFLTLLVVPASPSSPSSSLQHTTPWSENSVTMTLFSKLLKRYRIDQP